jgi:hypothetical protein
MNALLLNAERKTGGAELRRFPADGVDGGPARRWPLGNYEMNEQSNRLTSLIGQAKSEDYGNFPTRGWNWMPWWGMAGTK